MESDLEEADWAALFIYLGIYSLPFLTNQDKTQLRQYQTN